MKDRGIAKARGAIVLAMIYIDEEITHVDGSEQEALLNDLNSIVAEIDRCREQMLRLGITEEG